jgi:hypothetical protein
VCNFFPLYYYILCWLFREWKHNIIFSACKMRESSIKCVYNKLSQFSSVYFMSYCVTHFYCSSMLHETKTWISFFYPHISLHDNSTSFVRMYCVVHHRKRINCVRQTSAHDVHVFFLIPFFWWIMTFFSGFSFWA